MAEKAEYREFRELLKRAIGSERTQAQFAAQSGITPAHLNRLLNSETISQPSKATLMKIAGCANTPLPLKVLLSACGYEAEQAISEELEKLPIRERVNRFAALIESGLNAMTQNPTRFKSIFEFSEALAADYTEESVSISIRDEQEPSTDDQEIAEKAAVVTFMWGNAYYSVLMDVLLLYCSTAGGSVIVLSFKDTQGDLIPYRSDVMEGLSDIGEVKEKQWAVLLRTKKTPRTRPARNQAKSAEERLLEAIFGEADTPKRVCTVEGLGCYLDHVSDAIFKRFLAKHKDTFRKTEQEKQIYAAYMEQGVSREEAFKHYEIEDPELIGEGEWGGAISSIIFRETGLRVGFWSPLEYDKFDNRPAIIFSDKAPWLYTELEKSFTESTLKRTLDIYARELRAEVCPCHYTLLMDVPR